MISYSGNFLLISSYMFSSLQVAFVLTFMQELVQGKGVFQGLQEGDPVNIAFFGLAGISIVGLTAFLALKGDDDFTVDA
jgi:hypothetical protein